jgi:phosphoribosylaminoimidazole-succinocarboxamide synthase
MSRPELTAQLEHTLRQTELVQLGGLYRGKVRDTYAQGDRLVLVTTDRLSAFDRVLTTIPFKGELLNRLAAFWFEKTKDLVPNHLLDVPDPNVAVARRCEALPIEVVVRGHLTGSLWRDYQKGTHGAYGVPLPEGMKKDQAFDKPIITPSTKAQAGAHDEPVSERELLGRGLVPEHHWRRACESALALFDVGRRWAKDRGLILVDTKYEFGLQGETLYVIDEIHTPDCSRYWMADEYEARFTRGDDQRMMDKENIRQWLIKERGFQGHGEPPVIPDAVRVDLAEKYVQAWEQIVGQPVTLEVGEPLPRLRENLRRRGYLPAA